MARLLSKLFNRSPDEQAVNQARHALRFNEVAQQRGVSELILRGIIESRDTNSGNERDEQFKLSLLEPKADLYLQLCDEMGRYAAAYPQYAEASAEVEHLLALGLFDEVRQNLEKIRVKWVSDPAENCENLALQAQASRLVLNEDSYRHAAERFSRAAELSKDDPVKANRYRVFQADVLQELGEEFGQRSASDQAAELYRKLLNKIDPEKESETIALAQKGLGTTLAWIAVFETGTAKLDHAVAAYRAALTVWTSENAPTQWAMTQARLGTTLALWSTRETGKHHQEAVAALRAALTVLRPDTEPLAWGKVQTNLGLSLFRQVGKDDSDEKLHEAIAACRAAFQSWTRERFPIDWAYTQNNMGLILQALGKRDSGTGLLHEAAAAHREALKEHTRERDLFQWALVTTNLGEELMLIGEREKDIAIIEEGIALSQGALEVFLNKGLSPYYKNYVQQNIKRGQRGIRKVKGEMKGEG